MSERPLRLADRVLRRLAPLLTGIAAVLFDLLPLPNPAPSSLAPLTTVCVFYFWTVYRPDLMTAPVVFAIGLALDLAAGLPPGLTSLALLVARGLLLTGQRFLVAQPFAVIWIGFGPVVLAVAALRWLLASLLWQRLFPVEPLLLEAALTVAAYPVIGWLLARLHRHLLFASSRAARG